MGGGILRLSLSLCLIIYLILPASYASILYGLMKFNGYWALYKVAFAMVFTPDLFNHSLQTSTKCRPMEAQYQDEFYRSFNLLAGRGVPANLMNDDGRRYYS